MATLRGRLAALVSVAAVAAVTGIYVLPRPAAAELSGGAAPTAEARNEEAKASPAENTTARGWLGVYLQEVTPALQDALKLGTDAGALISDVVSGSPADKASLKRGDVITALDGAKLKDIDYFIESIGSHPGKLVELTVQRQGKPMKISVTLDSREPRALLRGEGSPCAGKDCPHKHAFSGHEEHGPMAEILRIAGRPRLGVELHDLDESSLAEYFGVSAGEGVLVTRVMDDSAASKAGLKPGDVIVELGGKAIDDAEELGEAVREAKAGEDVKIAIVRKAKRQTLTVKLPEQARGMEGFRGDLRELQLRGGQPLLLDNEVREELMELRQEIEETRGELREEIADRLEELQKQLDELRSEHEKVR
ncbi:MAG: PDZ domain-containing protein [Candidatus Schekmanbacteria bacterium]|nr:PDZ domain-containing protein [Candidatus Schekmanbacteria bacterium]